MESADSLKNKRLLIVDDEPDILETLIELLDTCLIDTAPSYETALKFLEKNAYDAAIFDIMGVRGLDLLKAAVTRGIPVMMLTAHALDPDTLVSSIRAGARAYVPKDEMADIELFSDRSYTGPPRRQSQAFQVVRPLKTVFRPQVRQGVASKRPALLG